MKLSIYLIRDDVKNFEDVVSDKYRQSAVALKPSRPLRFESLAYVRQSRPAKPQWTSLLQSHFNLAPLRLQQQSSSFILVLRVKRRIFAITFGYGFAAIERSRIESQFGLKTSLALLDDKKIRTLDHRNIDRLVRQRRTHVSSGSQIWDFGVSPSAEWVRYAAGKTVSNKFGTSVAGSDALAVNSEAGLEDLGDFCAALLKEYQSDEYRQRFDFLDRMQPLPKTAPIITELETELSERITKKSDKKLVIAYPEFTDERLIDHYRVFSGHQSAQMHDVSLSAIYQFMEQNPRVPPSVDKIWVVGEDGEGGQITEKHSLRDYLVCEVAIEDSVYYLSFGEWHQAARSFVDRIRKQVRELPDDTDRLRLPSMSKGEREDAYNSRVAQAKGWLLLDKRAFPMGGHDKIEVCDLYTPAGELIAVKKMRDSANLSHLFSQASVSAALLNTEEKYREKLRSLVEAKWSRKIQSFNNRLFVYAIPSSKTGSLAQEMFLFSQVNLLEHVRAIRTAGHSVSLCKIDYAVD